MTNRRSTLYAGAVTHQRFAPKRHRLRYRMFQLLLDLDEIPALARDLRLFSLNRFNVFSFHERDHGDGRASGLRAYVREVLAGGGIAIGDGKVRLLCMPRLFGHVFNPLSVYYCYREDGGLAAMVYEVTNTYHERHSYLIAAPAGPQTGPIRQSCAKSLFVSPFMDMAMTYNFTINRPGESLFTTIEAKDDAGCAIIVATFAGRRRALDDRALAAVLFGYPLLTLKVVAAIHWEAVRLFFKGIGLRAHPPTPDFAISVASDPRA